MGVAMPWRLRTQPHKVMVRGMLECLARTPEAGGV